MRHFAKAMMRLPLTVSLFGMKRLANRLVGPSESVRDGFVADALDRAEAQLGRLMCASFKAEDRLTAEVDPLLGFLTQDGLSTGHMMKVGFDATRLVAERFEPWSPGSDRALAWREFCNKLESFGTFRYAASLLDIAPKDDAPPGQWVAKAATLDPYVSVWATEGLGHHYAEKAWANGLPPQDLLTGALPDRGLGALHAGMGLSLAKHVLGDLKSDNATEMQAALRRFIDLCQSNARPGYVGVSLEALGLVVQTFHPHWLRPVDRHLAQIAPEALAFFWHGVGRGAYFTLRSSSAWRASDLAHLRAPHAPGRLNLVSGLAWPLVLVNIRHPEIVARFLARHGHMLEENGAFAHGVGAALTVWLDATKGDAYFDGFCRYRVAGGNRTLIRQWDALVHRPCLAVLEQRGVADSPADFEGLFRYAPEGDGG